MSNDVQTSSPVSTIRLSKIIWPVLIGLGVIGYMMYREFNPQIFNDISFTWKSVLWIFVAFLFMAGRDLGYMARIRVLSDKKLSWRKAFRVIMLWEFTSAITPSAVGGTSVAVVYVHKEGLGIGESSAIVLLTSFLDELYFIIMFPLVVLLAGSVELFDVSNLGENALSMGLLTISLVAYGLKLAYVILISYGMFFNPQGIKWLIVKVFKLRFLRRWSEAAEKVGDDIIVGSNAFKHKPVSFWMKAVGSTFLSWSSRYLVANALIMAFFGVSNQFMLFGRQLVIWIMMLVMPTPGGSGFAEYIFSVFCGDLIVITPALQKAAATLIAFMWRLVTYYPYLIIGVIVFPQWIKTKFHRHPEKAVNRT